MSGLSQREVWVFVGKDVQAGPMSVVIVGPFISAFWQPLFAGIQLDPDLEVSSRRFDVVLRMLATGRTCLPRHGMGAIPAQLAAALPSASLHLGRPVVDVGPGAVVAQGGERLAASAVVVATDGPAAHRLLGERVPDPAPGPPPAVGSPRLLPRSRGPGCCSTAAAGRPSTWW